jgi:F-type H+-transporting ATPase subunit gamma
MASTREIRRRIKGVKNIKQVTRAMNMIAAARLRRAQQKAESARPYAQRLAEILQDVQASAGGARHPLLEKREVKNIGLVLVTSDRGLAGAFNATIVREASHFLAKQAVATSLITVGKKGRDYFRARGATIDQHFVQPSRDVKLEELGAISKRIMADYGSGKYDQIHLAYSQFVSVLRSEPTVVQLLPLEQVENSKSATKAEGEAKVSYQFEPEAEALLNTLLPQYVEVVIYRALVESIASEQAARMIAMKAATDSASEMIEDLTRQYNRVRQGSITTQILEVVSGADALEQVH